MSNWFAQQIQARLTWQRAMLALALPLIAIALRWFFADHFPRSTYGILYSAVFLAAVIGGPLIGIVATAVGIAGTSWFLLEPRFSLTMTMQDV